MTKQLKNILMGVAAFAALGLGGSAIAGAASGLDQGTGQSPGAEVREIPSRRTREAENDAAEQVRGSQADRATAAALETTGGGRANSVERDSGNGATWEVEVTKPDGSTVDVRLDDSYKLVVEEGDSEGRTRRSSSRAHAEPGAISGLRCTVVRAHSVVDVAATKGDARLHSPPQDSAGGGRGPPLESDRRSSRSSSMGRIARARRETGSSLGRPSVNSASWNWRSAAHSGSARAASSSTTSISRAATCLSGASGFSRGRGASVTSRQMRTARPSRRRRSCCPFVATLSINTANGAAAGRLDRVGPIDRLSGRIAPVVR